MLGKERLYNLMIKQPSLLGIKCGDLFSAKKCEQNPIANMKRTWVICTSIFSFFFLQCTLRKMWAAAEMCDLFCRARKCALVFHLANVDEPQWRHVLIHDGHRRVPLIDIFFLYTFSFLQNVDIVLRFRTRDRVNGAAETWFDLIYSWLDNETARVLFLQLA